MKMNLIKALTVMVLAVMLPSGMRAKEKVDVSVGADVVSSYIWRGTDCGGVSIQPSLSLSKDGLSLSGWGSVGINKEDTKEFDLTLGYTTGGFNVALTDYWFDYYNGETGGYSSKYFKYSAKETAHIFEGTVGYDFGPVALSWNTYFAGDDYCKKNGDRAYSTYIGATVPFNLAGLKFMAEVGGTPWEGAYSDGANITNIALGTSKDIKVSDSFTVPASVKLSFNPYLNKAFFAFGLTF
jgi:hypothetical protein